MWLPVIAAEGEHKTRPTSVVYCGGSRRDQVKIAYATIDSPTQIYYVISTGAMRNGEILTRLTTIQIRKRERIRNQRLRSKKRTSLVRRT